MTQIYLILLNLVWDKCKNIEYMRRAAGKERHGGSARHLIACGGRWGWRVRGDSKSITPFVTLWSGRFGDRIPVGTKFSASVQTGPESHPASYKMGTGSLSRG
jgi:uncharacterized protein YhjY with autotransporter beta-barrel domain